MTTPVYKTRNSEKMAERQYTVEQVESPAPFGHNEYLKTVADLLIDGESYQMEFTEYDCNVRVQLSRQGEEVDNYRFFTEDPLEAIPDSFEEVEKLLDDKIAEKLTI